MSDLLKGLTGGGWAGLFAWILPSALGIALWWIFEFPEFGRWSLPSSGAPPSDSVVASVFFGASAGLGLLLSAASTPLYRLLEGYSWPRKLRAHRRAVHVEKHRALQRKLTGIGWERGLVLEALARYPREEEEITPTRLGNAIRAFERYGKTHFNLDSQTMWCELTAVAPKSLRVELDRSRALVDLFVAMLYVAAVVGVLGLAGWIWHRHAVHLLILGILACVSTFLWYELAITGTRYWGATVQALVNLGRVKLAEQLGLELPPSLDAERTMWQIVTSFVYYSKVETGKKLDPFRRKVAVGGDTAAATNGEKSDNGANENEDE